MEQNDQARAKQTYTYRIRDSLFGAWRFDLGWRSQLRLRPCNLRRTLRSEIDSLRRIANCSRILNKPRKESHHDHRKPRSRHDPASYSENARHCAGRSRRRKRSGRRRRDGREADAQVSGGARRRYLGRTETRRKLRQNRCRCCHEACPRPQAFGGSALGAMARRPDREAA